MWQQWVTETEEAILRCIYLGFKFNLGWSSTFFLFFLNHRPDSSWISGHKQSSVCGTQTKEVMCEQVLVKSQDIYRTWLQRREWKRCSHRVHSCIFSTFISLWQGAWHYCTCKLFILPSTTTTKILWSAWKKLRSACLWTFLLTYEKH